MKLKKLTLLPLISLLITVNSAYKVDMKSDNYSPKSVLTTSEDDHSYEAYQTKYPQVYPDTTIKIQGENYSSSNIPDSYSLEVVNDEDGAISLLTPEEGEVSWNFFVGQAGYYNISIRYYPITGRSSTISRSLKINDEIPFNEASDLTFHRIWVDAFNVTSSRVKDKSDIKPSQHEQPRWINKTLKDGSGYYEDNFKFYFNQGDNKITLSSNQEPMLIDYIELFQEEEVMSYDEALNFYNSQGYKKITSLDSLYVVQGEDAIEKTSPTLTPIEDRTSILVDPFDYTKIRMNAIGGYNWRVAGDYITWQVDIKEAGLYNLNFKVLQNFSRGNYTSRTLYINGKVPFKEAKNLEFSYNTDWYYSSKSNAQYLYYFEAGINTITLEATVGRYGQFARVIKDTINNLNTLYRDIVRITSVSPDPYQDYLLDKRITNLKGILKSNYETLDAVIDGIVAISNRSDKIAPLEKLSYQLKAFYKDIRQIQVRLKNFKDNISSLGTWLLTIEEQPLSVDLLIISNEGAKLPRVKANLWEKIKKEFMSFINSFTTDSTLKGSGDKNNETIEVWITSGKDQADLLRQLIDESFTPQYHINVDLKLVSSGVLLPATVTKSGPDVALGIGEDLPVNWAIRNAVIDLSELDGFDEVITRFNNSAITPYQYDGKTYALPDTQNCLVMFYRTDILQEIGVNPPKTWDDVISIIPILQRNNLEFYFPSIATASLNPLLYTMIIQNGGSLYDATGTESALTSDAAMEAFVNYSKYYTDYQFVTNASFVNRFRTGEMPIGISYYSDYNTLSVSAPEIRGMWEFVELPGTMVNGELHNEGLATTSGSIILATSKHKDASWEFLKWWTDVDAQVGYARGMESILGAAARYPTANMEALAQLPWPQSDYQVLKSQLAKSVGLPIIPGSYITGRNVDNAFRQVINKGKNPREVLYDYSKKITLELERKRKELGID
jgi:ABC-type glycerol-3-phosphate transport system substrate-binding protein